MTTPRSLILALALDDHATELRRGEGAMGRQVVHGVAVTRPRDRNRSGRRHATSVPSRRVSRFLIPQVAGHRTVRPSICVSNNREIELGQ